MSAVLAFLVRLAPSRIVSALSGRVPAWGYAKGVLLVGALSLAVGGFVAFAWMSVAAWRDNRTIAALAAGRDLPIDAAARPEVKFARAHFLLQHDRPDEVQALVSELKTAGNPRLLADLQYNLANARLRAALALIEQNRIDPAASLVRLANDGYRATLAIDSGNWDARYNLDVAMRLVRDFPQIEERSEETSLETPKRLWTDLPGLPKGLP
jgi:mxaK protein